MDETGERIWAGLDVRSGETSPFREVGGSGVACLLECSRTADRCLSVSVFGWGETAPPASDVGVHIPLGRWGKKNTVGNLNGELYGSTTEW